VLAFYEEAKLRFLLEKEEHVCQIELVRSEYMVLSEAQQSSNK
jgi:hypothetical protein